MQDIHLTRRDFLRLSTVTACGFWLAGCSAARRTADPTENYYLANRGLIQGEIRETLSFVQKTAAGLYSDEEARDLVAETQKGFDRLLPDLPYIGGDANSLTTNLYQSAAVLAFFQAMQSKGHSPQEAGKIIYLAIQRQMTSAPAMGVSGRLAGSQVVLDKIRQEAETSQKRAYPQDWVFTFVEGDGSFDYGVDYTECGICKYFRAQGAAELVPYLCILDFPMSQALNSGLARTTTLGEGGSRCDFRYRFGRPVQMEWTPDFLK